MASSSSVCHGPQSCPEPRFVEPRIPRLKLASLKPNSAAQSTPGSDPEEEKTNKIEDGTVKEDPKNGGMGGWSFIQALNDLSYRGSANNENNKVYVHPLVKRSVSKLSEKSLEMCTESLGSESGSDISDSSDELSSLSVEDSISRSRIGESWAAKKKVRSSCGFPPPLTSISGSTGCVQVRPRREGGRLVIQAVTVTESRHFHADRSGGRLRLRLVKGDYGNLDKEAAEEEAKNLEENGEETVEEEKTGEEEEDVESESACREEDMDGNCGNVGGEMGTGKLPRARKCGSGNWDSVWGLLAPPLQKPISQF